MAKTTSTKRALISALLALVMTVSMLVGTTFAWFTDSVTSANNVIKAGNLDITLEYYANGGWNNVEGSSELFDKDAKWEPGRTEVVYLKVENVGSLDLKYQLGVGIVSELPGINVEDNDFLLSDYIYFNAVVMDTFAPFADRAAAMQWATETTKISEGYSKSDALKAGDAPVYVALIVYMPETVGNEANHNGVNVPEITLGVDVLATQLASEDDSFGSGYDEDAFVPGMLVYNASDLQAALANGYNATLAEDITISETIVVPESGSSTWALRAAPATVIDLNGFDITANETTYAIKNFGNLIIRDSVGTGSITARGIYNGSTESTSATLKVENGVFNAIGPNGGACIFNYGSVVVEDGTFSAHGTSGGSALSNFGSAVINGGSFSSVGGYSLYNEGAGIMEINDATVTGGIYNYSDLTINGGIIKTTRGGYTHAIYQNGSAASLVVNGGDFEGNGNEVINANATPAVINGGTFTKVEKATYLLAGSQLVINDGKFNAFAANPAAHPVRPDVTVNGGTFNYQHNGVASGNSIVENGDGTYSVLPGEALTKIANGLFYDGADTYYVTTAEGLSAVAYEVNRVEQYAANIFDGKTVLLENDIDLGGIEWAPIGNFGLTSRDFGGTFDGQGHTVSNFKVTTLTTDSKNRSSYGLFGNISNATIKNLTVSGAMIDVDGGKFAGALVGRANAGSVIENCHVVDSSVTIYNWQVGGLVGQLNEASKIIGCSVDNTVVTGSSAAGLIVGYQMGTGTGTTLIEDCIVVNSELVMVEPFGEGYDTLFGIVMGYHGSKTVAVEINNVLSIGNIIKGEAMSSICGENGGSLKIDGVECVSVFSAAELVEAISAGKGIIVLGANIEMPSAIAITNKNVKIYGNGFTVSQAEDATNNIALFDVTGGSIAFNDIVFDGIKGGALIRTVGATFSADNITVKNAVHTKDQGLLRLLGDSTIANSKFINNECTMVISFGFDTNEQVNQAIITNSLFQNNTCKSTGVVYYANGSGCVLDGNSFIGNTTHTSNGATVYLGFKKNCTVTNNLFENNTVYSTHKRSAGALMIGNAAEVTGNAFIGNKVVSDGLGANDVCASAYYAEIDLSGNFWGGKAPVEGDDYYNEYPTQYDVIVNDYLTVWGK